jgi:hypothetical protein
VIRGFGRSTLAAKEALELNRSRWAHGDAATFAISDTNGQCIGHVFVNLGTSRRATVVYWLLPEARGRGLATRAVRLTSRWALRDLGLARLGLFTEPSNDRSQRGCRAGRLPPRRCAALMGRNRRPTRRLRVVLSAPSRPEKRRMRTIALLKPSQLRSASTVSGPGGAVNGTFTFSVRGQFEDGTRINTDLTDHFNVTPPGAEFFFTHCHD